MTAVGPAVPSLPLARKAGSLEQRPSRRGSLPGASSCRVETFCVVPVGAAGERCRAPGRPQSPPVTGAGSPARSHRSPWPNRRVPRRQVARTKHERPHSIRMEAYDHEASISRAPRSWRRRSTGAVFRVPSRCRRGSRSTPSFARRSSTRSPVSSSRSAPTRLIFISTHWQTVDSFVAQHARRCRHPHQMTPTGSPAAPAMGEARARSSQRTPLRRVAWRCAWPGTTRDSVRSNRLSSTLSHEDMTLLWDARRHDAALRRRRHGHPGDWSSWTYDVQLRTEEKDGYSAIQSVTRTFRTRFEQAAARGRQDLRRGSQALPT